MRRFKDTFVSRNSALWNALDAGKGAKKIYDETTANFLKLYGKDYAAWFINKHKENNEIATTTTPEPN